MLAAAFFFLGAVREREFRGERGEGGVGGVILVSEGRSTLNPNSSFYVIYLFIYLFIYPDSSSCEAQSRTHLRMLTHFNKKIIILIRTSLFRNRNCIFNINIC